MTRQSKLLVVALVLLFLMYVASYVAVRQHRLSLKFAAYRMIFDTEDQGNKWVSTYYSDHQRDQPLDYDDSEALFVLFWPLIRTDAALTGRGIQSPFEVVPYRIPQKKDETHNQQVQPIAVSTAQAER